MEERSETAVNKKKLKILKQKMIVFLEQESRKRSKKKRNN